MQTMWTLERRGRTAEGLRGREAWLSAVKTTTLEAFAERREHSRRALAESTRGEHSRRALAEHGRSDHISQREERRRRRLGEVIVASKTTVMMTEAAVEGMAFFKQSADGTSASQINPVQVEKPEI